MGQGRPTGASPYPSCRVASRFGAASQNSFLSVRAYPVAQRLSRSLAALWFAERQNWPLLAPVAFAGGIAAWFGLPWVSARQAVIAAAMALMVSAILAPPVPRRLLFLGGLLFIAGLGAAETRSIWVAQPRLYHWLSASEMRGSVDAVQLRAGGEGVRIRFRRDATDVDPEATFILTMPHRPPPFLRSGVRVSLTASLSPTAGPILPGAYDPGIRAWFEGVSAQGRITGAIRLLRPAEPSWRDVMAGWRQDIGARVRADLSEPESGIAIALIVGDQGGIDRRTAEAMRVSGLAHLLSVSGMHVMTVIAGVAIVVCHILLLSPWFALRFSTSRTGAVCGGMAGVVYVMLSGAEVPAVRALIMAGVGIAALCIGRNPLSLRLLGFAAMLILAVRPEALVSASFQLSFAAVASLALLARSAPGRWLLAPHRDVGIMIRVPIRLAALLVTGAVVELTLFPIVLAQFGRAGVYGAIANMAAIPLTTCIIMPILGLYLVAAWAGQGAIVAGFLAGSIGILERVATTVAEWPGAAFDIPLLPPHVFALVVLAAIPLFFFTTRLRWAGLPFLVSALVLLLVHRPPDILIAPDARQVGVVSDGRLRTLRAHREGFLVRNWAAAAHAPLEGRLSDIPGAVCSTSACLAPAGELWIAAGDGLRGDFCRRSDVAVLSDVPDGRCRPRWLSIDRRTLVTSGAIAITSGSRRFDSVAARAGDHPWSPASLPGQQMTLLGRWRWTGVIVE